MSVFCNTFPTYSSSKIYTSVRQIFSMFYWCSLPLSRDPLVVNHVRRCPKLCYHKLLPKTFASQRHQRASDHAQPSHRYRERHYPWKLHRRLVVERWNGSRAGRKLKGCGGIAVMCWLQLYRNLSKWSRDWEVTPHCSIQPPPFDDVLVVARQK